MPDNSLCCGICRRTHCHNRNFRFLIFSGTGSPMFNLNIETLILVAVRFLYEAIFAIMGDCLVSFQPLSLGGSTFRPRTWQMHASPVPSCVRLRILGARNSLPTKAWLQQPQPAPALRKNRRVKC